MISFFVVELFECGPKWGNHQSRKNQWTGWRRTWIGDVVSIVVWRHLISKVRSFAETGAWELTQPQFWSTPSFFEGKRYFFSHVSICGLKLLFVLAIHSCNFMRALVGVAWSQCFGEICYGSPPPCSHFGTPSCSPFSFCWPDTMLSVKIHYFRRLCFARAWGVLSRPCTLCGDLLLAHVLSAPAFHKYALPTCTGDPALGVSFRFAESQEHLYRDKEGPRGMDHFHAGFTWKVQDIVPFSSRFRCLQIVRVCLFGCRASCRFLTQRILRWGKNESFEFWMILLAQPREPGRF